MPVGGIVGYGVNDGKSVKGIYGVNGIHGDNDKVAVNMVFVRRAVGF